MGPKKANFLGRQSWGKKYANFLGRLVKHSNENWNINVCMKDDLIKIAKRIDQYMNPQQYKEQTQQDEKENGFLSKSLPKKFAVRWRAG